MQAIAIDRFTNQSEAPIEITASEDTTTLLYSLKTLVMLHRNHNLERKINTLIGNISQPSSVDTLLSVANKLNYSSAAMAIPIKKISSRILPAILIFDNNQSCVLTKIQEQKYIIIKPELNEPIIVNYEELFSEYSGILVTAKPSNKH